MEHFIMKVCSRKTEDICHLTVYDVAWWSWVAILHFRRETGRTDVSRIGGEGEKWSVNYCSHSVSSGGKMGNKSKRGELHERTSFTRLISS